MAVSGRASFSDPLKGKGSISVRISTDDWETVETITAPIHVPLAQFFLPVRGLVELDDGRLLVTMYGRMDGDRVREDSPVGFELNTPWIKTRVIVVESRDRGKSWQYLSTLSYNPHLGFEGQNESDIIRLADGHLFAAMRTGIHGYVDIHGRENLDQPLLVAWSADNGSTWSVPQRIYVDGNLIPGIYPRILLTENGVLAVLRTRGFPGGSVVFSPDGRGAAWTDQVAHFTTEDHVTMQDMALIGPNTILVADVLRGNRVQGIPITVKRK